MLTHALDVTCPERFCSSTESCFLLSLSQLPFTDYYCSWGVVQIQIHKPLLFSVLLYLLSFYDVVFFPLSDLPNNVVLVKLLYITIYPRDGGRVSRMFVT
ncbi:hypothetical protein CRM22_003483 [Opisthorchis felineus]|uniref:Uncharacterized protein n=1 Tax=Opisthorchis felineus TaxID=147828 RepID=A0A4S2M0Z9_OPIFE|nr:hypothetical protein CRM22_003483 [Opisthorchis felineus]